MKVYNALVLVITAAATGNAVKLPQLYTRGGYLAAENSNIHGRKALVPKKYTVNADPEEDLNCPPNAQDDEATTLEDTPVTIDVTSNDSLSHGDSLVVDSCTTPANGSVSWSGPDVTYNPDPGFVGTDTFVCEVCDEVQLCDEATVSVIVVPVNGQPVAQDDTTTTEEDTPVNIDVLANDSDPDGDNLTVTEVSDPPNGSASINPDGTIKYTPDTGFTGVDTFDYTVCDNGDPSLCDTATVTVTVTPPENHPPDAKDDQATTEEDTPVNIDVLANDSDPDGDNLTVTEVSDPSNGSTSINPDGTIKYTPDTGFTGVDTFDYTVCDNGDPSLCDTATVTVTVKPGPPKNHPPDAKDDQATTEEDTLVNIDVLANDSDPDGDNLTVTEVSDPSHGSTSINPDGTIKYTPDTGFTGVDTFDYTVCDNGDPSLCDTATVTVTVTAPENRPPVAQDDTATTEEDTPVNIAVLANDSDPDGDTLTLTEVSDPPNGSTSINPDGTIKYTPDTGFTGAATFNYTVCDNGDPPLCDIATVTVMVTAGPSDNNPPVAQNDTASTPEDNSVTINVTSNDIDPDGDTLTVESCTTPANGSVSVSGGSVTYEPDPGFVGTDTFECTVCDDGQLCDGGTVSVTVDPVNGPPVAQNDETDTPEDTPVTIDVTSNDSDPDGDTLTVDSCTTPVNGGSVSVSGGDVTYTPATGFVGTDTFECTVCDVEPLCDDATVSVVVGVMTEGFPIAQDDSASTNENEPVEIDILSNDSDPDGDVLTVQSCTDPPQGTVTINSGGTVTYTPDNGYAGTDSFTCTVCDPGPLCDTALVTVEVQNVEGTVIPFDFFGFLALIGSILAGIIGFIFGGIFIFGSSDSSSDSMDGKVDIEVEDQAGGGRFRDLLF